ncbi:MAG: PKD domain-containing protein [Armatimonadetes bacterium]|nr:PKD domain-containing protein [Akkermansiaceae bacterium]
MKTTCPHCSQRIEIDQETLASLQGSAHFECPMCSNAVAVPLAQGTQPVAPLREPDAQATSSLAPFGETTGTTPLAQAHRGLNRNLLILGSAALLVLGGLGVFLASRSGGNFFKTNQNIANSISNNTYFQNLIASGATTEKDLMSIAEIRPYGEGFIGISKESLAWEHAEELANRTGSEILAVEDGSDGSGTQLLAWLGKTFNSHLISTVWVRERGEVRVLDGGYILAATAKDRHRKVVLDWGRGKNLGSNQTLTISIPTIEASTGKVTVNGGDARRPTIPFTWDWGDGSSDTGWFPSSHTYQDTGRDYTLTMTAHYGGGKTARAQAQVSFLGLSFKVLNAGPLATNADQSAMVYPSEGWARYEWQILINENRAKLSPNDHAHGWFEGELTPDYNNRPLFQGKGKRSGIMILHPESANEPAKIVFRGNLNAEKPVMVVAAAGSVHGDHVLRCVVNGKSKEEHVLDGTVWRVCTFDLSDVVGVDVELELWNVPGGKQPWQFETCYIDQINFVSKADSPAR